MQYCEHCRKPIEGDRCPWCGKKHLRELREDDLCFLEEKELIWSEMLADVLKEQNIPFLQKNVLGAGLTISLGTVRERVRFYVYYRDLEAAEEVVKDLFSTPFEESDEE